MSKPIYLALFGDNKITKNCKRILTMWGIQDDVVERLNEKNSAVLPFTQDNPTNSTRIQFEIVIG